MVEGEHVGITHPLDRLRIVADPRRIRSDLDLWEHDPDVHWPLLDWRCVTSFAALARVGRSFASRAYRTSERLALRHTGGGIVPVPHETALIATIAVGLAFALIGGYIAVRLHLPPLVGLPGGGYRRRAVHARVRRRPGARPAARGDRRHPAHVRRGDALLAARPPRGARRRAARRPRADRPRHGARRRRRDGVGLVARRGTGVRTGAVGGEHRRAAPRAGGAGPAGVGRWAHRGRLADRRGSRDRPRARAPPRPRRTPGWTGARRPPRAGQPLDHARPHAGQDRAVRRR